MKSFNDVISGVDFEEIISKTKSYAAIATKKGSETLELSRKKIELLDSKTKLSKAYEKYGKLMYLSGLGEKVGEEELSSAVAEIQLQKTRSDLLDSEIADLKAAFKKEEPQSEEAPEVEVVEVEPED